MDEIGNRPIKLTAFLAESRTPRITHRRSRWRHRQNGRPWPRRARRRARGRHIVCPNAIAYRLKGAKLIQDESNIQHIQERNAHYLRKNKVEAFCYHETGNIFHDCTYFYTSHEYGSENIRGFCCKIHKVSFEFNISNNFKRMLVELLGTKYLKWLV